MKGWEYQITVHPDPDAGTTGMTDVVRITVESGDPGGCLEYPFEEEIRGALRKWYDTGNVSPPVPVEYVKAGWPGLQPDPSVQAPTLSDPDRVVSGPPAWEVEAAEDKRRAEPLQISRDLMDLQDLFRCLLDDLEELHGKDRNPIPDHEDGAAWDLYCRIQTDQADLLKKYGRPQGADKGKGLDRPCICQGDPCLTDGVPDDWKAALGFIQKTVRKSLALDHLLTGLERIILEYEEADKALAREGKADAVSIQEVTGRIRRLIQEAGEG